MLNMKIILTGVYGLLYMRFGILATNKMLDSKGGIPDAIRALVYMATVLVIWN